LKTKSPNLVPTYAALSVAAPTPELIESPLVEVEKTTVEVTKPIAVVNKPVAPETDVQNVAPKPVALTNKAAPGTKAVPKQDVNEDDTQNVP
jgi:hypothetical protein